MRTLAQILAFLLFLPAAPGHWEPQNSGVDASFRGISVVSAAVAWVGGTKGVVLRTMDAGTHWENVSVPGAEALDFRAIHALDGNTAFAMSAGPGDQSRIYHTMDGGRHWQLQFSNQEPKAFYDCFAFWDPAHGIALSDSVNGRFLLLSTADGQKWSALEPSVIPAALPEEGAFAASGTCIATFGSSDVWFATGGPAARVFHSADRGNTWTAAASPIRSGASTQGIFSIAFWSRKDGVIVGGDYKDPKNNQRNAAFTHDGGKNWTLARQGPNGYRSAVAVVPGSHPPMLIAAGTTGSDYSLDGGNTWQPMDGVEYNSLGFAAGGGWAVGPQGRIARFSGMRAGATR